MKICQSHSKAAFRHRILDANWNDYFANIAGNRQLSADVVVVVAFVGKDQQERDAPIDRISDHVVKLARRHITRRDPAFEVAFF